MLYLDASVVVSAVTNEPNSAGVRTWLRTRDAEDLCLSTWTLAEAASALSAKLNRGELTVREHQTAFQQAKVMLNSFARIPIDEGHLIGAMKLAGRPGSSLRAGDALHVAMAADFDQTLVTMDRKQAEGAAEHGLAVIFLPEASKA